MEHDVRKPMTGALKPRKSTENPVHQRHDSRAISFVDFPIQSNPIQSKPSWKAVIRREKKNLSKMLSSNGRSINYDLWSVDHIMGTVAVECKYEHTIFIE